MQRDEYLDCLARSPAHSTEIRHAASDLVEPLRALTSLSQEVFGDLNPEELKDEAEDMMLTVRFCFRNKQYIDDFY